MSEGPTRLDQQEARQGRTGVGVRNVLIGSLVLIVVAFAVIFVVMSHTTGH